MTDKEIGNILDDMVIIVDSREKSNVHILEYFNALGIKHKCEKLDSADYSFILPNYQHLFLDKKVLVERKGSIDEIVGNLSANRDRFIREFERLEPDQKISMVLENLTWKKVNNGSYRSKINPKSIIASLITWETRYNCPMYPCTKEEAGMLIYNILKYGLRERLKKY